MARKTAQKVDYLTALDPELLLEIEGLSNDLSQFYTELFSYASRTREIYQKICNKYAEDLELANKLFNDYKKRGNFNLPTNLRDLVFEVAVNTKDFSSQLWESFVDRVCQWRISTPKVKALSKLSDRGKLDKFLRQEKVPTAKEIDEILPKKAIRSITPNKPFSQEYLNVAIEKLKLDETQQMWLESRINELSSDEEEKSTNHLIKALACGSRGDISFAKNELKISKNAVLKALNSAAKTAFTYENNLLNLQEENDKLHDRQEQLELQNLNTQSQLDRMQEQLNRLMGQTAGQEQKVLAGVA